MANVTEQSLWEVGVYQIETSDAVIGGVGGIANRQALQLANRTLWLKNQVAVLGTGKQDADSTLTALANLTTSADKLIYATGADQFGLTPLTAFIRTLLDDADAAAALATLGAYSKTQVDALLGTKQASLGYTPVQQGGGAGQDNSKVYIGWRGTDLGLQVDSTNFSSTWPINISGGAPWAGVWGKPNTFDGYGITGGTINGKTTFKGGTLEAGGGFNSTADNDSGMDFPGDGNVRLRSNAAVAFEAFNDGTRKIYYAGKNAAFQSDGTFVIYHEGNVAKQSMSSDGKIWAENTISSSMQLEAPTVYARQTVAIANRANASQQFHIFSDNDWDLNIWSTVSSQVALKVNRDGNIYTPAYGWLHDCIVKKYVSAELTISSLATVVTQHLLGAEPMHVSCFLRCVRADGGYDVGDLILADYGNDIASDCDGLSVIVNATTITVKCAVGSPFFGVRKDTGREFQANYASWKLIIKATL